jgi:hypothetical protein
MFMPEVTAFCYTFGENCGLDLGLLVQQDAFSISDGLERALQIDWPRMALARHVRPFTWLQTAAGIERILASSIQTNQNDISDQRL